VACVFQGPVSPTETIEQCEIEMPSFLIKCLDDLSADRRVMKDWPIFQQDRVHRVLLDQLRQWTGVFPDTEEGDIGRAFIICRCWGFPHSAQATERFVKTAAHTVKNGGNQKSQERRQGEQLLSLQAMNDRRHVWLDEERDDLTARGNRRFRHTRRSGTGHLARLTSRLATAEEAHAAPPLHDLHDQAEKACLQTEATQMVERYLACENGTSNRQRLSELASFKFSNPDVPAVVEGKVMLSALRKSVERLEYIAALAIPVPEGTTARENVRLLKDYCDNASQYDVDCRHPNDKSKRQYWLQRLPDANVLDSIVESDPEADNLSVSDILGET
jgi:hypothetical protein